MVFQINDQDNPLRLNCLCIKVDGADRLSNLVARSLLLRHYPRLLNHLLPPGGVDAQHVGEALVPTVWPL
jgi:hypothetical protein